MRLIDLTGQKFGRLTVIRRAPDVIKGKPRWECLCNCGGKTVVDSSKIKSGATKSCGCLIRDTHTKHGQALAGNASPEYMIWGSIIRRTTGIRKGDPGYENYKGRGIGISDSWRDFRNFIADMGPRPSAKHSIDRTDNDAGYSKENCKWVLRTVQARNRRSNRLLNYKGEIKCLAEWADVLGFSYAALNSRLQRGWDVVRSLETPIRKR